MKSQLQKRTEIRPDEVLPSKVFNVLHAVSIEVTPHFLLCLKIHNPAKSVSWLLSFRLFQERAYSCCRPSPSLRKGIPILPQDCICRRKSAENSPHGPTRHWRYLQLKNMVVETIKKTHTDWLNLLLTFPHRLSSTPSLVHIFFEKTLILDVKNMSWTRK